MLRRTVTALATAAALAGAAGLTTVAVPATASAHGAAGPDALRVTVSGSGDRAVNGTVTLICHPSGGSHPRADAACDALDAAGADRAAADGNALFAPVPKDANCAMIYGGPVTARITGTWHGKHVDAEYSRANGCEINRWDRMVPALPAPPAEAANGPVAGPAGGTALAAATTAVAPSRR